MKLVKGQRAKTLAKMFCPTIVHGLTRGTKYKYDFFTEIYLSPFNAARNGTPAIYYRVMESEGHSCYILYGVFHRIDSKSHPYDFEGFGVKIRKGSPVGIVTVSHFMFLYNDSPNEFEYFVKIEPGGHGIKPVGEFSGFDTVIRPAAIEFIPMYGKRWDYTVKTAAAKFGRNGVKFPWEWNSFEGTHRLRQYCKAKTRDECNGMIWDRQDLVHRFMRGERTKQLVKDLKQYVKERKNA